MVLAVRTPRFPSSTSREPTLTFELSPRIFDLVRLPHHAPLLHQQRRRRHYLERGSPPRLYLPGHKLEYVPSPVRLRDPPLTRAAVPASVALQVFPVVSMAFAAQGILTASSRMTYAFARDGGEYPISLVMDRDEPR